MTLTQHLRKALAERGWSVRELGRHAGIVSTASINQVLRDSTGTKTLRADTLAKVAGALGVSTQWLLGGDDAPAAGVSRPTPAATFAREITASVQAWAQEERLPEGIADADAVHVLRGRWSSLAPAERDAVLRGDRSEFEVVLEADNRNAGRKQWLDTVPPAKAAEARDWAQTVRAAKGAESWSASRWAQWFAAQWQVQEKPASSSTIPADEKELQAARTARGQALKAPMNEEKKDAK